MDDDRLRMTKSNAKRSSDQIMSKFQYDLGLKIPKMQCKINLKN